MQKFGTTRRDPVASQQVHVEPFLMTVLVPPAFAATSLQDVLQFMVEKNGIIKKYIYFSSCLFLGCNRLADTCKQEKQPGRGF